MRAEGNYCLKSPLLDCAAIPRDGMRSCAFTIIIVVINVNTKKIFFISINLIK